MRAADLRGFGPVGTNGPKPASSPVDVLAVMERDAEAAFALRLAGGHANPEKGHRVAENMRLMSTEARAAVAELVEAARNLRSVSSADDAGRKGWDACARLDAALAKFGVAA